MWTVRSTVLAEGLKERYVEKRKVREQWYYDFHMTEVLRD